MMKEASASNSSGTTVTHPPHHDKWKRARQKPTGDYISAEIESVTRRIVSNSN